MRITENLKSRLYHLSIRKRLTYSNVLMFLIPVSVTVFTTVFVIVIAALIFKHVCLPRMNLTPDELHETGEQYKKDLKFFLIPVAVLLCGMLVMLLLSIVFTNCFLPRFMFRRVEEPFPALGCSTLHIGTPLAGTAIVTLSAIEKRIAENRRKQA